MFVKLSRDMAEPFGWFPHSIQFELQYWQRSLTNKKMIEARVSLKEFAPLHDYYSEAYFAGDKYEVKDLTSEEGLRGRQYDLRITFIPVDWMDVLNKFKLNTLTYVIFYFVIDAAMVILIM